MKKLFAAIGLVLAVACSSGTKSGNTKDSTATTQGTSDGLNTTGSDVSHIDTSSGKIKSDSIH